MAAAQVQGPVKAEERSFAMAERTMGTTAARTPTKARSTQGVFRI